MDSTTLAIKDKYLAGAGALVLLACYMILMLKGADTKFIEGAFLVVLGVFGGLLKQTASQSVSVEPSGGTTNVINKPASSN